MEHPELEIRNRLAGRLRAGVIAYEGISPSDPAGLARHIESTLAALRGQEAAEPPPGYAHSRRLYRGVRIDPTRHRPSSEALWRRFREDGGFPRVLPLVDLTNLLSLLFQVPYGLYDLDKIEGPQVTIDLGGEGDSYPGIRKETLGFAGKIVLRDGRGAFGNPSADSLRTAVTGETRRMLQVIFFHPEDPGWREIQSQTAASYRQFFAVEGMRVWDV
jgi:DNA/RNA-binding domain of Phe-tRNA-synthetase-like protein